MNISTGATILLVSGVGLLVIIGIIYETASTINYLSNKRFLKKYPRYAAFVKEYNRLIQSNCDFHNNEIAPIAREIDNLEKSKAYLPQQELEKVNIRIEQLKIKHFELNTKCNQEYKDLRELWKTKGKEIAEAENYKKFQED